MIKTYGKRGVCRSACMEFPSASMRLQRYNLKANPNHWDAKFCKAHHATFKTPGQASGSRGMFADWRSPAPPGAKEPCCQSLPKLLSQAFAAWRGWGADSAATLLAGCLFLRLPWQWIVWSRLGIALLSFVLVSWCVVCFWAPPFCPPRLLTRQLCGSDRVCRPECSIIRVKNNSIYLKPDESFVHIGGRVSISWLQQIL